MLTVNRKNSILEDTGGDFRNVYTGGRRNEEELTAEQYGEAKAYAVLLGMPEDRIAYGSYELTCYGPMLDILLIGTDVLPGNKRSKDPNNNVSLKGTIAHEIIGHREAWLKGLTQPIHVLEEAQASIRAARFAPNLDRSDRIDLIRDAIYRLHKRGISLRMVKDKLNINER
ncbi:MAG: hypothetical protein FWC23_07475 [Chitinispirillia bacterium]|nr:hypothetical protein [Chitinispirillia bacterium]MCL2269009.1 hypothetical protein [Chitinispirillia bacterium]